MQDQPDTAQAPNSAGEVEDPAQIPPAPEVDPESKELEVDPAVEKSYTDLEAQ